MPLGSEREQSPADQPGPAYEQGAAQQGALHQQAAARRAWGEARLADAERSEPTEWEANDMEQPIPLNVNAWRPNAADRKRGVPLATLEEPSSSRFELTPSPVPRVSLAPATGSVDISLVPGPNSVGLRNLPTLAARHVLGRPLQRAAARALTFPPTATLPAEAPVERKAAASVRSSKREIVLGLGIGIGLSVLLGVVGQTFLDPVDQPSLVIESTANALSPAAPTLPRTASRGSSDDRAPDMGADQVGPGVRGTEAPVPGADATGQGAAELSAAEVADAARASAGSGAVASSKRKLPRSSGSAKARASDQAARDDVSAPRADRPGSDGLPGDKDRKPLSPSESAGLGLDLPF
jgi:hypothetical protein